MTITLEHHHRLPWLREAINKSIKLSVELSREERFRQIIRTVNEEAWQNKVKVSFLAGRSVLYINNELAREVLVGIYIN